MGRDGSIIDPSDVVDLKIFCYECGRRVILGLPITGHDNCLNNGKLPVRVEWDNYEEI